MNNGSARARGLARAFPWARDLRFCSLGIGVLRIVVGAVFLGFGPGKFVRHAAESDAFARYGIPFGRMPPPMRWVYSRSWAVSRSFWGSWCDQYGACSWR